MKMNKLICYTFLMLMWDFISAQKRLGDQCIDQYTDSIGRCELPRLCQSAKDNFHKNNIQPTFCTYDFDYPLVCCRDGVNILNTAHNNRNQGSSQSNKRPGSSSRRTSDRKCEEYSKGVTQTVDILPLLPDPETVSISAPKCNYTKVELIVGGETAEVGEFPHMTAIGYSSVAGGYSFKCGGSLISERFVLTAGHCLHSPDRSLSSPAPAVVRLGDHNIDNRVNDGASPIEVPVKQTHKHPDYNPPNRYNDIGLLELANTVEFVSSIRPACLWSSASLGGQYTAVATGWGVTNTGTGRTADELQKVSLNLYDNNYCDPLLEGSRNRHWDGFRDTQLCAGELRGGKDTCQGDSGGPLQFASRENQCIFHIVGITSFGKKCARIGEPAIYTRVSSYVNWIESIVWPDEA